MVLDIEVQGARHVRTAYPKPASTAIFVIPPSPSALIERLRKRRTESAREMGERLAIAVREVEAARHDVQAGTVFDHIVVNDDLNAAVQRVIEIVEAPDRVQHRTTDMMGLLAEFVRELEIEADRLKQSTHRSV